MIRVRQAMRTRGCELEPGCGGVAMVLLEDDRYAEDPSVSKLKASKV